MVQKPTHHHVRFLEGSNDNQRNCTHTLMSSVSNVPSEFSVISVTFWPFCMLLEWPPLETESLASEPLSCSS